MAIHSANRLGFDYKLESKKFSEDYNIIDFHSHIGDAESALVFKEVMDDYGVKSIYTMTQLEEVDGVSEVLGDRVHFITFPKFRGEDTVYNHKEGYSKRIKAFHEKGARIVKFWAAPRGIDLGREFGEPDLLRVNAPHRIKQIELAQDLGMMIMVHVSDPDTWFNTKYKDSSIYGTKPDQYKPFIELVTQYKGPWIAAHMGGNPEDLSFLRELLENHPNLYIDSSATKWVVRELSKYQQGELEVFLTDFKGRVLFGSDIVTSRNHLVNVEGESEKDKQSSTKEEAYSLYASRYFALRTMFETSYRGESPIADPDLALVEPDKYCESDAPELFGHNVSQEALKALYYSSASQLMKN